MQNKKRLHKHLLSIYIIYFIVLIIGFAASFAPTFSRGHHAAQASLDLANGQRFYFVEAPVRTDGGDAVEIDGLPENVTAQIDRLQLYVKCDEEMTFGNAFQVVADSGYAYLTTLVGGLAYLAIFVLIALIINSLRKSIRDEQPLRHSNIPRTRAIGILMLVAALCDSAMKYLNMRAAAELLAGSSAEVVDSFPLNYWDLIVGILFLFMAEVISIGAQLSEEQKLTI